MTDQNHLAELLDAAGEDRAAQIVRAARVAESPPDAEPAPEPARQLTPAEAHEAQRQAAGRQLLDQIESQTSGQWISLPIDGRL